MRDDEAGSERVKALRAAWPAQIAGVPPGDLVFVDESGVNLAMTRLYARSRVHTRAFGSAPRHWGDNASVLGALSLRGPLASMSLAGSTDGAVFLTYLKKVLVPRLWKGAVVVMDNLGAHKVKGVQEQIEAAGARLVYLPLYSADLHPIEPAWHQFKSYLRTKAPRTRRTLARAIREGLARIRPPNAKAYFAHCGYR